MAAGVVDDGSRRVEPHRPGVEQRRGERVVVVALEPSREIRQQGEAGGVRLREAVLPEAADLIEHALGELARDAVGLHPRDQPLGMLLDGAGTAPRGHVAAQLIRLAGGVVGGHHRQFHHLLLEQRHSQRLGQHRAQRGVGILHRLIAVAAPQVGMDHAAGDRSGAHDRDLNHQIVEGARAQTRQHRHLRPALDLEHPDGVAGADHVEHRRVLGRHRGHGVGAPVVAPDQVETEIQMGEGAESEQVHLEQAQGLDVVLVPLNDGAPLHGGVLDRDQGGDRLAAEQKAAGMDRQVAREVEELVGQLGEDAVLRDGGVQSRLLQGVLHRHREVAVVVGDEARRPVQLGGLQGEGLADLAEGGSGAVAHHVGDHGGMLAAILPIHELNRLLAPAMADVEVDVGRLGALAGQEALEQQVHAHRVDGGDAQAVAHRGVGRGAASLARDLPLPAEADHFVHGQEVAAVVELLDDRQLGAQLPGDRGRNGAAVAPARPGEGQAAQPLGGGVALRQPFGGIAVAQFGEREGAAGGDLAGGGDQLGAVPEQARERRRRLEVVLGVGAQQRAGGVQRGVAANAGDHVLQPAPAAVVVEHFGSGGQGNGEAAAQRRQTALDGGVGGQPMARDQPVEAVGERLPELSGAPPPAGRGIPGQQQPAARPERDQAAGVGAHLLPAHPALALGTAPPPARDEAAEVDVARLALHQQQHRQRRGLRAGEGVDHRELGADDQARGAVAGGGHVGARRPVDAVPVGQHQGGEGEFPAALHQFLRVAGPLQKREVALAPQRHVPAHSIHPWRYQRRVRRSW